MGNEKSSESSITSPRSSRQQAAIDSAVERFVSEGNKAKLAKNWPEAGECFKKAAREKAKGRPEGNSVGGLYENAARSFITANNKAEAMACVQEATTLYNNNGNFAASAKLLEDIASLLEKQGMIEDAAEALRKAADCYEADVLPFARKEALIRLAEFLAKHRVYVEAGTIYEQVATEFLNNEKLRSRLMEYWYLAVFCKVGSGDMVDCRRSLEKYVMNQPEFERTREYRFCHSLLACWEGNDVVKLQENCQTFQKITPFLDWQLIVLESLYKKMGEDDLT